MSIRHRLAWLLMVGSFLSGIALSGCNTVEGVGRDVEAVGDSIEDAADED